MAHEEAQTSEKTNKNEKAEHTTRDSASPPPKRKRQVSNDSSENGSSSPNDKKSKSSGNYRRRPDDRHRRKSPPRRSTLNRAGGVYVPPAKLRMLQAQISDKASIEYQRIAWEALKKSILGLTNKVNIGNLPMVVRDLIGENLIRGKGLFVRSVLQAQEFSQSFTHVYAALIAVINTKFPEIGELLLKRLVIKFRNSYVRNQKPSCLAASRFIAHLTNQNVVDVVLSLQIILKFLNDQTDDSIELAVGLLKESGQKLTEVSTRSMHDVFDTLREILQNAVVTKRTQFAIEVLLAIRRGGFKEFPAVQSELDLVDEADQITHDIEVDTKCDGEYELDVFKFDPEFELNEKKYAEIKNEILGEGDAAGEESGEGDAEGEGEGESSSEEEEDDVEKPQVIPGKDGDPGAPTGPDRLKPESSATTTKIDKSEAKLISLRRTIYLTIQSSLDYEECAHKVVKLKLPDDEIEEVCHMVLDCCAQQRTYEKFYGLLGQRFCLIKTAYAEHFQNIFRLTYETIHRLETNKLRNVAKFFAHLLHTDSVSWLILSCIKLNEDDTTSAGRIFIKHLTQELAEFMGIPKLEERTKDVTLQMAFDGLFPRDHPRNTRFAINFFTVIGLGALTDELREWLKTAPKQEPQLPAEIQQIRDKQELLLKPNEGEEAKLKDSDDDSSSTSSSSLSSDSSSDSDSDGSRKSSREPSESGSETRRSKKTTRSTYAGSKKTERERSSRRGSPPMRRRDDERSNARHYGGSHRDDTKRRENDYHEAADQYSRSGRRREDEENRYRSRCDEDADRHYSSHRDRKVDAGNSGEEGEVDEFGRFRKSSRHGERHQVRDDDGRDDRSRRRRSVSGGRRSEEHSEARSRRR